ncbi:MAG: hypothetical protein FWE21_01165 [Defluviitaleaceae bacterium]|nr:hypothetical protein [Defluviitaleaceae bacterium]
MKKMRSAFMAVLAIVMLFMAMPVGASTIVSEEFFDIINLEDFLENDNFSILSITPVYYLDHDGVEGRTIAHDVVWGGVHPTRDIPFHRTHVLAGYLIGTGQRVDWAGERISIFLGGTIRLNANGTTDY